MAKERKMSWPGQRSECYYIGGWRSYLIGMQPNPRFVLRAHKNLPLLLKLQSTYPIDILEYRDILKVIEQMPLFQNFIGTRVVIKYLTNNPHIYAWRE